MRLNLKGIFFSLGVLLYSTPTLQAQTAANSVTVAVNAKGDLGSTIVTDPAIKFVIFEAVAKGSMSQVATFVAHGPANMTGSVTAHQYKGQAVSRSGFDLLFPAKRGRTTKEIKASTSAAAAAAVAYETPEEEAAKIERIKAATGLDEGQIKALLFYMTEAEIIKYYGKKLPTNPGEDPNNTPPADDGDDTTEASIQGSTVLHKDACKSSINQYLVRFIVNLSAVDPARYATGITVKGGISLSRGAIQAASIKPSSDGKYSPNPLFLMESLGGYSENLNVIIWSGGKPRRISSVKIADYIYYKGYRFARAVASKYLSGGTATVEISDSSEAGGACFRLVRSRQNKNGYPQ